MLNLLIADNHLLTREGIRSLIKDLKGIRIVDEAANSEELHKKIKEHQPEVVIIDYNSRGFRAEDIGLIYKNSPDTRVMVITDHQQKTDILKVLGYGVINFILKICDKEEFQGALKATIQGEKFFCGRVLDAIIEKHFPKNDLCEPIPLSVREIEIVQLIGEGLTNNEIALRLSLSVHTVNTHRKNILKKLQLKNASELIMYAIKNGIIPAMQDDMIHPIP
jgi:DNA-binding NarL/FixJ family response regulator